MYQLNFWLVICIAKNFICTTLKAIFTIFRFYLHPQIPDIQIVVSQLNIVLSIQTIHQWKPIYSSFRWCINKKLCPYDWFCGPCHDHMTSLLLFRRCFPLLFLSTISISLSLSVMCTERSLLCIMSRHAPYCWLATSFCYSAWFSFLKRFWKNTYPTFNITFVLFVLIIYHYCSFFWAW